MNVVMLLILFRIERKTKVLKHDIWIYEALVRNMKLE